MRYYGVLTGQIFDKHVQMRKEQPDESLESWDCFYTGISSVTDETGKSYGDLLIWMSGKTALRYEKYIVKGNNISFDCTEIKDNKIKGIRNLCSNYCIIGFDKTRQIVDKVQFEKIFKREDISCNFCKYANKKELCEKYKTK